MAPWLQQFVHTPSLDRFSWPSWPKRWIISVKPRTTGPNTNWQACQRMRNGPQSESNPGVAILDDGTRKLDLGYEVPITWREGELDLINNRPMVEDRSRSLLRRFERDSQFEADYRATMKKTLDQGYASRLTQKQDISSPIMESTRGRNWESSSTQQHLSKRNA
jgi:hypothetical protein